MSVSRSFVSVRRLLVGLAAVAALVPCVSRGDDWPYWMGPQRDNVWREEGIIERFPEGGPKVVWRAPLAGGYAGAAVVGDRLVITDYQTGDNVKVDNFARESFTGIERVHCLNSATGETLWTHEYPVTYTMSYPAGPRCTPVIHDGMVYTLGAEGHLICFELETGKIVWQKHFATDYAAKTPLWGFSAHPLLDGDKLISLVGGEGTHCVAFDRKTGAEIWRSESSDEPGYSPPTIIEAAGKRQLILAYPAGVASVDPETGKRFWHTDYEATNGSIIMSPLKSGNLLYIGGYSNKNLLLELGTDAPTATEVWRDKSRAAISPVNVQPALIGDTIFGMDQGGLLMAVDLATGNRVWTTPQPLAEDRPLGSGTAFMVRHGERWFLFSDLGDLVICEIDREGYREIDRAPIIKPTNVAFGRDVVWCAPAYAGKRMFVRNDEEIICVDLAK
ncbi:MAG TPA: PQQ-like beta-propeller repeat protein [Pirellulaceae bacterium]|nr:PQQ-like beta-propeller repeat protein [Pirellulaceae bacterium]